MDNDNENKINLEKGTTPPPPPSVDEEWAKKLHLNFDPASATPPPPPPPPAPAPSAPQPAPSAPQNGQMQPTAGVNANDEVTMPPTYLLWSVLSLVFCCLPAAVVAIIYSAQVSSKFYARDYEGARRCSERAQIWIIVAIVLGVVTMALYIPLSLLSPS